MPANPDVYADMLGEKMKEHNTEVYLVNTGWSGGAYGTGSRIKLPLTRRMVNAALEGELKNAEYVYDPLFHVNVPKAVEGIPSEMLFPKNTWEDKAAYDKTAQKLASEFTAAFDKNYGNKNIKQSVINECPGK
jgi:phosphoenolpyruvate carboxykinase (ATP)